jgi:hypothetical protein
MPRPNARDLWGNFSETVSQLLVRAGGLTQQVFNRLQKTCRSGCANLDRQGAKNKGERKVSAFHKKTSTLPMGELRIAPCFLGPQSGSLAASARGFANTSTGRSSDSRIILLPAPSLSSSDKWQLAGVVPGYSGGTVTDLHRLPFFPEGTCNSLCTTLRGLLSRTGPRPAWTLERLCRTGRSGATQELLRQVSHPSL